MVNSVDSVDVNRMVNSVDSIDVNRMVNSVDSKDVNRMVNSVDCSVCLMRPLSKYFMSLWYVKSSYMYLSLSIKS